jgi:hypothetical protein
VDDNAVERRGLLRCGVHHPLKLGTTVVRSGCSRFDELGDHGNPLPVAIGVKLPPLIGNRQIMLGLAAS